MLMIMIVAVACDERNRILDETSLLGKIIRPEVCTELRQRQGIWLDSQFAESNSKISPMDLVS